MDKTGQDMQDFLKDKGEDFVFFITGLGMQVLIALGHIPNPADNKKEQNLTHAKYMIDTLDMISRKTKNNLDANEGKVLADMLCNLRMQYVEASGKGPLK
ncbi:MAG: DUF1844 domain-containing protein [Candidatus Omnitrophica bacterium]|jgi:hypothetical protein|nr:DUF1844 domain-containing protein [Candidatus Omnitrophota bacterium]